MSVEFPDEVVAAAFDVAALARRKTGPGRGHTAPPLLDRLLARTDRTGECWRWTGTRTVDNYGNFALYPEGWRGPKVTRLAHRLMYELMVGPAPEDMTLDHLCHKADGSCPGGRACMHRRCVNPSHLEPKPHVENVLRGVGPTATNARKTHCDNGHPFDDHNTYIRPSSGGRDCRICIRERLRQSKARRAGRESAA